MKRVYCFCCVILVFLMLTACDPGTYRLQEEAVSEDVVSVELIQYDNPKQKKFTSWVPDHFKRLQDLKLSSITVLETLPEESLEPFLEQMSKQNILWHYYVFDSPKGLCIRVNYDSGDFLMISTDYENESFCGYIGMYNAQGEVTDFFGSFESYRSFATLVSDYFDANL